MKYCKYCKREYKCYDRHITTNKHFLNKITTKEVKFSNIIDVQEYILTFEERNEKYLHYIKIKESMNY